MAFSTLEHAFMLGIEFQTLSSSTLQEGGYFLYCFFALLSEILQITAE